MNLTGQYATDFQNILNKAVQVAQIPLSKLQAQDTYILGHKTSLGSLGATVSALTASLTNLGALAAGQALSATSSNPAAVTVSDSGATSAASYAINSVTSAASAASETSLTGYANSATTPITTGVTNPGQMQLMVGATPYNFTLTNNNLTGLMNQINGLGAGVTASILTTAGGNYLSLQSNGTGAAPLQLNDLSTGGSTDIVSATTPGTDAVFQLNGIPITQASNTVNSVIPGMTFNIVGATNSPVTLTLASDSSQLSSSLQDLVTNYNSLAAAVQAQQGPNAGALLGDPVIGELRQAMHQLTSYQGSSGSVRSLADLGVTFNSANGAATFDPTRIAAMSTTQVTDALKYVGSASTGLGAFSKTFGQISDPISGLIQIEVSGDTNTDAHLQSQMAATTANIINMQKSLAKQIEAADALESAYESQQQTLTASLQGLYLTLYGKSTGTVA
jgi:flagellar hook-associated protein 2